MCGIDRRRGPDESYCVQRARSDSCRRHSVRGAEAGFGALGDAGMWTRSASEFFAIDEAGCVKTIAGPTRIGGILTVIVP